MTGLLLLCILPGGQFPGTDVAVSPGTAINGLAVGTLTLWTRSSPRTPEATLEELRAHHATVEAAWRSAPAVLPVRFGQWFATEADLVASVEPRVEEYERALAGVQGMEEHSLRLLDPGREEPPAPADASGTAYLRAAAARAHARAAAESRGREVAAALDAALDGTVRDTRIEGLPTPHGLVTVAHLVPTREAERYREGVDRFARENPALRILRTGPWPPWSFSA